MLDRALSTLELTALGVIYKRGPCLAHAVVTEFSASQTSAYRSGAGSIYPLLRRLTEAGLLSCEDKRYTISAAGLEALRTWVLPPLSDSAGATTLDSLRSRTYFLKLLDKKDQVEFCRAAIEKLSATLASCVTDVQRYSQAGDRYSELAMLGAVRETESRIAWLNEVLAAIETDQN